jgi:acylphosphatase
MRRVKIRVFGRVQGVFFRASAQAKAQSLAVSGNAVNLPDGSVEIIAEANEADLAQFIDWCHLGPSKAKVDKVEVVEIIADEILNGFETG